MKRLNSRLIALATVATFVAAVGLTAAPQADPFAGSFTLNVAKSTYDPGPAPKSGSVTFSTEGAMVKAVIDGVTAAGDKAHWEYAAAFDGKDHPMKGNPDGDTVSLRRISPTSVETTFKLKGKVMVVNVRTLSADGKTMTVTTKGTNAQGQKVNNVQVFEKKA
jgi:histidinol dehydrogenase